MKSVGQVADHYSTRQAQIPSGSGPLLERFKAAPLERNTRGFQPRAQPQLEGLTSNASTLPVEILSQGTNVIPRPSNTESTKPQTNVSKMKPDQQSEQHTSNRDRASENSNAVPSKQSLEAPAESALPTTFEFRRAAKMEESSVDEFTFTPTSGITGNQDKIPEKPVVTDSTTHTTQVKEKSLDIGHSQVPIKEPNRKITTSESFTMSSVTPAPHVEINALHKYAWNNGINPKGPKSSRITQQPTPSPLDAGHPGGVSQQGELGSPVKFPPSKYNSSTTAKEPSGVSEQVGASVGRSPLQSAPPTKEQISLDPPNVLQHTRSPHRDTPTASNDTEPYVPPHLRLPKAKVTESGIGAPAEASLATSVSKPSEASPSNDVGGMKTSQIADQGHSHLPPHLRALKAKKPTGEITIKAEPSVEKGVEAANGHIKVESANVSPSPLQSSVKGKGKAMATADEVTQNKSNSASLHSPEIKKKPRKYTKLDRIMMEKGWDPVDPDAPLPTVIGDWDNREQVWEERTPHNYGDPDHITKTKMWTGSTALEEPVIVDTSAPEFAQGIYIPGGERPGAAINEEAHATYLPDDPYTAAKVGQTAQAAIEAFKKKKADEEPPKPKLTRAQKRETRQTWLARRQKSIEMELNHPNKPAVDIYIRPAEWKDLTAITQIYNWYIANTAVAPQLVPMTVAEWRGRIEDCRTEGFECYVAVQRSGREAVNGRHRVTQEPICGFAYAGDMYDRKSIFRFVARMEVFVSKEYPHVGVGRCLVDRVMCLLDINRYARRGGCEWRGAEPNTRREIKKIYLEIPYWDQDKADMESLRWRWQWLTGEDEKSFMQFEHSGTLHQIGWKQRKT